MQKAATMRSPKSPKKTVTPKYKTQEPTELIGTTVDNND